MSAEFNPTAPHPEGPFGPPDPLPEAPKTSPIGYLVGAEVGPDGTVDTFHALEWRITPEDQQRRQESAQRWQEREQQRRKARFAIPDYVHVGTAQRTWYELRNMALLAQERLQRDPRDIAAERTLRRTHTERDLLEVLSRYADTLRPQPPGGDAFTPEQSRQYRNALPAVTMSDMLANQVDHWESEMAQNPHAERPEALRSPELYKDSDREVLDAAHDLVRRLNDQASRSIPHTH